MNAQLDPISLVGLVTLLGLMPFLIVMVTSFTKFSIVLTLLRSAL